MHSKKTAKKTAPAPDVFEALRTTVQAFGVGEMAQLMGISAGVLYAKINLHDEHHKPGLADLIQVMKFSGDTTPLTELCRVFNGVFVSLPDLSHLNDNALLEIVNRINAEGGDVFRVLAKSLEKDGIDHTEQREIDREIDHVIAAYLELRARTQFMSGTH